MEGLLLLRRCPPAPDPAPGQSPEQGAARLALRMPPPRVPAPIPAEARFTPHLPVITEVSRILLSAFLL